MKPTSFYSNFKTKGTGSYLIISMFFFSNIQNYALEEQKLQMLTRNQNGRRREQQQCERVRWVYWAV